MKYNSLVLEEEVRMFPFRYIESVHSPDGRVFRSNHEMHDSFWAYSMVALLTVLTSRLGNFVAIYLADYPRFREAKVASYEGLVTECKVRDALKQVGLNKSPELDGLP